MDIPPFLTRLIGDRTAVAAEVAPPVSTSGRFPTGLVTNVLPHNPYRPDVTGTFPDIPVGWHPGVPPRMRPGHVNELLPRFMGRGAAESAAPFRVTIPKRIIPGSKP